MRLFGDELDKEVAMAELKNRAAELAPAVCGPGHELVWGEGSLGARIAIVGEAPGDKEEKLGQPFVGPAGRLLDKELEMVGIDRKDIWITNVVKCRPTRATGSGLVNRPPTAKEVHEWMGLLREELEIVRPEIIVCAGAVAANALIHKDFQITKEHGQWFSSIPGQQAIATFHPAYILRQQGEGWNKAINAFRGDMRAVAVAVTEAA